MAKTKQYCVAENWGKGFIEYSESSKFVITSFPGNVWQVPAFNKQGNLWIAKVAGSVKTFAEAQALVNTAVKASQAEWDALSDEDKANSYGPRPTDITLEE